MSPWSATRRKTGFTLIEVVGALVIFSVGVLMVMDVSGALGTQMRYAGARSELVVRANELLDSIESTPVASLVAGTWQDTATIQGLRYEATLTITSITAVLVRIEISAMPLDSVGPSYAVTSYTSAVW